MSTLSTNTIVPVTTSHIDLQGISPPTYLGSELAQKSASVQKSGDTMSGALAVGGALTVAGNASTSLQVVPLQQLTALVGVGTSTGTFSPALSFVTGSTGLVHTNQDGRWTRIGNMVNVNMYTTLSAKGSSTGNLQITNLPFVANGVFAGFCLVDNMVISWPMQCITISGTGTVSFRLFDGSSGNNVTVNNTHVTNTAVIHTFIQYWTT